MSRNKDEKPERILGNFLGESPVKDLFEEEKPEPVRERTRLDGPNWRTETYDPETGWIYELKGRSGRGKKLRKFYENLGRSYRDKGFAYWKPKIYDLVACEAKRFRARQYYEREMAKVTPAFDLVLKNVPFKSMRIVESEGDWTKMSWVEFPKYNDRERQGVSWNWVDDKEIKSPKFEKLKVCQEVGDAWFNYEERSQEIRERVGRFEQVFDMALKHWAHQYNPRMGDPYYVNATAVMNLIINGRNYLVGQMSRQYGYGYGVGIICPPENLITIDINKWQAEQLAKPVEKKKSR